MVDVRWDLDDRNNYNNRIASWVATPAIVENVKFNGKTWVLAGMPMPKIKARTCFMVMEVCSRIWHCSARFSPCCPQLSPRFSFPPHYQATQLTPDLRSSTRRPRVRFTCACAPPWLMAIVPKNCRASSLHMFSVTTFSGPYCTGLARKS